MDWRYQKQIQHELQDRRDKKSNLRSVIRGQKDPKKEPT